jgi:predicted nucleic acid-binding protein
MRFWDASAIVPLLIAESSTRRLQTLAAADPAMLVWWASEVECVSALSRLEREGALTVRAIAVAHRRLGQLAGAWHQIDPSDAVREAAIRFLRVHPLRAADALQLAAAFLAAERRPASLEIITLDDRMGIAAQKEGFKVISAAPAE